MIDCKYAPVESKPGSYRSFRGAVLDTGAPTSVIGSIEARLYCSKMGIQPNLARDLAQRRFRFGENTYQSLGLLRIVIPVGKNPLSFDAHVIPLDIPLLLGLETLIELELIVDPAKRELRSTHGSYVIPLLHDGHLVLTWSTKEICAFYTQTQIERLHRHFAHPSATKLYEALRKAKPEDMNEETRTLIDAVTKSCHTCQRISIRPLSFSIRINDELAFNQELLLDIMYYNSRPILHIVDAGTHFSAARFLPNADSTTVWTTFVQCWSNAYIGHPESMLTDQGSVFISQQWSGLCRAADIQLRHTGIEAHNSLNAGETLHAPLRRILRKMHDEHPELSDEHALSLAVYAMNATTNERGLCPMLLVFGVLPKIPEVARVLPCHVDRIKAMHTARQEYNKIIAERRVRQGLKAAPPSAASAAITPGDMVYVWREGPRCWMGPVPVLDRNGKDCTVLLNQTPKSFNITQLKPARVSNPSPAEKTFIFLTEVIEKSDPRAAQFDAAKKAEILSLIDRGTFSIVLRPEDSRSPKPNILPSRFVLAIKHKDTGETKLKARFVVGGHRDREKRELVHVSNTVKHSSLRLLVAVAAIFGFDLWSMDVRQAYLQAATPLLRDVYVEPPRDVLNLNQGELLKLLKPLYGLSDAGDYWAKTLSSFHTQHLRMRQATGDFSLFMRHVAGKLVGMSATHVDDLLCVGTSEFTKDMQSHLHERFEMSNADQAPLTFTGIEVTSKPYGLRQRSYIRRLTALPQQARFDDFRSQRARLSWVVHTRPDIACVISMASQVTKHTFSVANTLELNNVVSYLQRTSDVVMKFPRLDQDALQIVAYSDASFGNLPNGASQLGYAVFLVDGHRNCSFLTFKSYKARRIARSSTTAETLALVDAFDAAFLLRHDLQQILRCEIPLLLLTDSQIVFETLVSKRTTAERRLMIDLAALREAYDRRDVANIGLIASADNVADGLTKTAANSSLWSTLNAAKLSHPVQRWVTERDRRSEQL